MVHDLGIRDDRVQIVPGKIGAEAFDPPFFELPGVVGFQRGSVVVAEGIDATDRMPQGRQTFAKVGTDKACGAGHKDVH